MNFKAKRIQKKNSKKEFIKKLLTRLTLKKAILGGGSLFLVIYIAGANPFNFGFFNDSSPGIFSLKPLKEDKFGHTNILLLGVAGDMEEGGNLSDSIMVVSVNPNGPSASFLSLPRDLFISSDVGDRKINEIYAMARHKHGDKKGLEVIKKAVSRFTNIELHYAAVVQFSVFEEIVDAIDGVDIFVPQTIEDHFYPADNYQYQTFVVRKGMNHLDGEMALKYARSRKTSSDYDRARRQQDLILAIRKKAKEQGILTNASKLQKYYTIFRDNVNTDIGFTQIIALAKTGLNIDYQNSITAVLNDDPMRKDGFLYTPAREFYGGQFVLLPENLRDTQLFMNLILIHPETLLENAQISVLNGSKLQGLAKKNAVRLRRFGFHVIETGNYESDKPVFRSFVRNYSGKKTERTARTLADVLDAELFLMDESITPVKKSSDLIDIEVVLGTN